jgi:hypothetical protein
MVELVNNATVNDSIGVGPRTFVVTLSKSSISQAEMKAAIQAAENEGNTVAGTIVAANVVTLLLQGAGITDGSNYGATGVTSATTLTFTQ